jgi:hypothetical protein
MTGREFIWYFFPWIGAAVCLAWLWYDKHYGYGKHSDDTKSGKNTPAE